MKDRICRLMEKIAKEARKRGYDAISCHANSEGYINWFTTRPEHIDMTKLDDKSKWKKEIYK